MGSVPIDEPACGLRFLHVENLAAKPWDLPECAWVFHMPNAEPREVVAAVTQGCPSSHNMNSARASVNESNSDLASDLVTHKNRNIHLTIAIKIAALVERVHSIVPLILSLELSA